MKPLTKDDFWKLIHNKFGQDDSDGKTCGCNYCQTIEIIEKYQEKAEKWDEFGTLKPNKKLTEEVHQYMKIVERLKELDLSGHILFLLGHTNILPVGYDKGKLETIVYDLQGLQKSLEVKK